MTTLPPPPGYKPSRLSKSVSRHLSEAEQRLVAEHAATHGARASASTYGVSKESIYDYVMKFGLKLPPNKYARYRK